MKKPRKVAKKVTVLDKTNIESALSAARRIEEPTPPQFSVSLKLDKTILEGSGDTVLEALNKVAAQKPIKITTKSVLTVMKGDKRHSRALTIPLAKRLFMPKTQQFFAKQISILLK